jgi:PKD repeat protein
MRQYDGGTEEEAPMKRVLGLYLAALMTVGTALSQNAPGAAEPTLQAGIKQFGDGDLAGAVFTLEAVIRTLAVEPALHAKELSQAYLYRGAAFVGLSQEENAKGSFAAALQYDRTLRIGEDKFPPRVVRVFEAARTGKTKSVLLPPSNVAKKAGIGTLGIVGIIAGVAAVGGGVAAATHGSSNPSPPVGSFTVSPPSPALASATVMTFSASATDPGGNTPITYQWNFGDGTTGSGHMVTHVFMTPSAAGAPFTVTLTIQNSKGAQSTATGSVVVKSLTGHWVRSLPPSFFVDLTQNGSTFAGSGPSPAAGCSTALVTSGVVTDPRSVSFDFANPPVYSGDVCGVFIHCTGSLDLTLDHLSPDCRPSNVGNDWVRQ